MLFKTRKKVIKEYVNEEINKEIEEKWFSVYNYISMKELFMTIQRDYLEILSKINIFFGIVSIWLWVLWYISNNFSLLFIFLAVVYSWIFLILIVKFVARAYYFMKITDVAYTDSWIILWNKLYKNDNEEKLIFELNKYEEMFEEFLSKPSNLEKVINKRKKKIFDKNLDLSGKLFDILWDLKWDWLKLAIPVVISYFLYAISLYIFYYLWYFLGFFIFFIAYFFLIFALQFSKNTEVKIKWKIEDIDSSFKNMKNIDKILSNKISNFKDWEISNISKDIEKNFSNFYSEIISILEQKKKLFNLINNSKFKDFVNFEKLENYIKINFNKPVSEMISMLDKFEQLLEKQINLLKMTNSNNEILDVNIDKKQIVLENNLKILRSNKQKLEKSIIS